MEAGGTAAEAQCDGDEADDGDVIVDEEIAEVWKLSLSYVAFR